MWLFFPFWAYRNWHFGDLNQNSETTFQYKLAPKTPKKPPQEPKLALKNAKVALKNAKTAKTFKAPNVNFYVTWTRSKKGSNESIGSKMVKRCQLKPLKFK